MAKRFEIYKCEVCGNIVEVLHGRLGELVCCDQPMKLMEPETEDPQFGEKHIPVIEKVEDGMLVKVGSVAHPMEEKHYIQWIELVCEECGMTKRKYLKPGDKPEAKFYMCPDCDEHVRAREYCNIHGHWKG